MNVILVFIGGGLGSVARYAISLLTSKTAVGNFPLGTFISNILACLILVATLYFLKDKLSDQTWISTLVVTGFCGGFSTFSTWSKETVDLIQQGNWAMAVVNVFISLVVGIGLIWWVRLTN